MRKLFLISSVILCGLLGLVACNLTRTEVSTPIPTATHERIFTLVQLPTQTTTPEAVAILQQSASPFPTNTPLANCPPADTTVSRIRYDLKATLDWTTYQVNVEQIVHYRNDHLEPLYEIVFHTEPRRLAGIMSLQYVMFGDQQIQGVTLDGWRLVVPLPEIAPGCDVEVKLVYRLDIRPISDENPYGWLAYSERQLNLGHWFPTVGLYGYESPGEWYTPMLHFIGEQAAPELADFMVRLQINNAPNDLKVAAPGTMVEEGDNLWHFELKGGRDFALSMSTQFRKLTKTVGETTIELYYLPNGDLKDRANPASRAMLDAEHALALYDELFSPYPFERLVIVEGDFPDGLEFSGLVFVGEAWFRTWNGETNNWLTIITVHEVAHQWWYASVGNNQAHDPYLDEALATYSELLYYEHHYPEFVDWWWNFRVFTYQSDRPVDDTVYEYSSWRPYINAVYLRGVMMLQAIRDEIGDEIFMQWWRDYATNFASQIASPQDFWGSLPPTVYWRIEDIRRQYMQNGDILPPVTTPASLSDTGE